MKTAREFIAEIKINDMNLRSIADNPDGRINGSLLVDIERVMRDYAKERVIKQRDIMAKHLNMRNVPNPEFQ